MTLLFDRKAELHIFLEGEKHILKDYDMSFDILATRDSKPNTAKINVFNQSETIRNLFSESTKGVEFWAGYGTDIGMIFRGSWDKDSSVIKHVHNGSSWDTAIETGDGLKEFQNTFFSRSYLSGTTIKSILKNVSGAMGLPITLDYDFGTQLNSSAVYHGKAKDVLDDLALEHTLQWSIQHGVIEILDTFEPPRREATAVLLSTDTGLVGSPILTDKGVEANTLMLSTIKPTRLIKIDPASLESQLGKTEKKKKGKIKTNASGVYIVDRIRYFGDTMGGKFNCKINSDLKT